MNAPQRTALVTGATSGLGFETAIHLADAGYRQVIVTGRTIDRATDAVERLVDRTGRRVFEPVALDLDRLDSVERAAVRLSERDAPIDALVLNAGMVSGSTQVLTDDGIEVTFASSLIGHHLLTMRLVQERSLAPDAHVVISGSEASRGDVPTFRPVDLHELATRSYGGDRIAAATALIRGNAPIKYSPATTYATTKLFVAYWAAALARRLPERTTVVAVSPGSAPDTGAARNGNLFMKRVMLPMMRHSPKFLGMRASTPDAAQRYVDALRYGPAESGRFYASKPKKMTGPVEAMTHPHITDREAQEAAWIATVEVSGAALAVDA